MIMHYYMIYTHIVFQCNSEELNAIHGAVREFTFRREVGLSFWSTFSLRINTKIIGNMN